MDYYLNEYSLRGQFESVEDFFESLRSYTFPVLKKVNERKENIIWKKDTLWQSEICKGVSLTKIPQKKNERSGELARLKIQLIKLTYEPPFYSNEGVSNIEIKEYKFDTEYREKFDTRNCFTNAIENEGRVISFLHPAYECTQLPVNVNFENSEYEYCIENIYTPEWWNCEPEIKTWRTCQKYLIEVRAKEFDYHPPHFHVSKNEFAAVFKLNNGELYREGKKKWTFHMINEIKEWYEENKCELQETWNNLHNS